MAGLTLTYTLGMSEPARAIHAGVNCCTFHFDSGATKFGTLSDVLLLGRLPPQCVITNGYITTGISGAAAIHWTLTAVDANDFTKSGGTVYGSMTQGVALATFRIAAPVRISLSADSTASSAVLYLNCTTGASGTVSTSFAGCIEYVVDGRDYT